MGTYHEYMDARQADRSPLIGPSSASACIRKLAYRYTETQQSEEKDTSAADLGTLLHLGWSAMIRSQFDPSVRATDVEIDFGGPRPGSADDVNYLAKEVTDLKSVSGDSMQWWLNNEPPSGYWDQLQCYGLGLQQRHGGLWTLTIHAIATSDSRDKGIKRGAVRTWSRWLDPDEAQRLVDTMNERHRVLAAAHDDVVKGMDPDLVLAMFPREGDGPGTFECDYCEFRSMCWPDAPDDFTPQSFTLKDDPDGIGQKAAEYLAASADESKARKVKHAARQFLVGLTGEFVGPDGDTFRVSTSGGNPKKPEPDCAAMQARLIELGEEIPTKHGGFTARQTRVNRKKGR